MMNTNLFRQTFRAREDVVARHWTSKDGTRSGYAPICSNHRKQGACALLTGGRCRNCSHTAYAPLTDQLLGKHFNGGHILGVYPLLPDGTCWFIAGDFDDHHDNGGPPRDPLRDAIAFYEVSEVQGIRCYLERSKSGKGLHCWIFFAGPVPAWKARLVAFAMLREAGVIGDDAELSSFDRLFPNQDRLTGKGLGNLIALPFQGRAAKLGNTLLLDPGAGFQKPYRDQVETLQTIQRVTVADLDRIIADWNLKPDQTRPNPAASGTAKGSPITQCGFLHWCSEHSSEINEPLWYALISNVARLPGGVSLCHELSKGHPGYSPAETDAKILQALDASGPHTCEWIKANGFNCGKTCRVKSPCALVAYAPATSKDQGPTQLELAKAILADFGPGNVVHTTGGFTWQWNGLGVWTQLEDREIRQRIHDVFGQKVTKSAVESIQDLFKTEAFRKGLVFDQSITGINVLNGELHWNGFDWELKPHNRESYRITQIPVAYDPKAKAPRFERFLNEIFEGDSDATAKGVLSCEMLGYSALASCAFEKFFMLLGPGANGKSVLLHVLEEFVGRANVSAIQPSQFENRFQRAHLFGKLVNVVTEIAEGHELADAQLKAIVSGELTTAEHKHKPPFDFRPYATCVFATNHMPHTRDFSDALFRRAIIIPFNRTFTEEEQDRSLKSQLVKELPGILNLALSGMAAVFLRGAFTTCESVEAAKGEWRLNCDQVAQFVDDRCKTGPGLKEISAQLYNAYLEWTKTAGIRRTLNHKNFSLRLVRLGCELGKGMAGVRFVHGLELSL